MSLGRQMRNNRKKSPFETTKAAWINCLIGIAKHGHGCNDATSFSQKSVGRMPWLKFYNSQPFNYLALVLKFIINLLVTCYLHLLVYTNKQKIMGPMIFLLLLTNNVTWTCRPSKIPLSGQ
jgi:hypothetical protein